MYADMCAGWVLIEVCDANLACTPQLYALEEKYPGVSVLETSCMSHCELCARSPYVFVDGEIVTAPSVAELLQRVEEKIDAILHD